MIVARLQAQRSQPSGKEDDDDGKGKEREETEEEYTGVLDAAWKLYQKGGIKEFYPGLAQDTAKTVADNFLFFLAYSFVRQRRIKARFGERRAMRPSSVVLPVLDELTIGILAGAFSKLITTPLANIVTRKQTSGNISSRNIAARIRSEKGIKGFWSGYSATLILTLNPSITLFLNELLKYALLSREKRERPSPATTFLLAAMSKAAASSVTYPFSMAKTRAQVSGKSNSDPSEKQQQQPTANPLNAFTPQILTTVYTIARSEGLAALYAGLLGEVLKGFFSHGFTMLTKDAVYSLIVKAYYLLLYALRKYPTPEELIERAREQAEEYAEAAREGAKDLAEKAKNGAEDLAEKAKNGAEDLAEKTKNGAEEILESQPGHITAEGASHNVPEPAKKVIDSGNLNDTVGFVSDYVDGDKE